MRERTPVCGFVECGLGVVDGGLFFVGQFPESWRSSVTSPKANALE
ncbi:hypothetical protein ACWDR3_35630 [Streptomyces sp. NPDC001002]